jgi:hypothetical protein
MVKDFLVNTIDDCDIPLSKEYHKIYVRCECVNFSPTIINKFFKRAEDGPSEPEVTDNVVCKEITANQVKVRSIKGLGKFIYIIGTKTKMDYGAYIFEQTVRHAKKWLLNSLLPL